MALVKQQDISDTHIDELGTRQPNPPRVSMIKVINHIEANRGKFNEGKHIKFPIASHLIRPYNHHIIMRVDTGANVNCVNETTFNELFPEVQLSVCAHKIQNVGNSSTDISILGQFCMDLLFKGEKYLNTFIVTNANDCPNIFSYSVTFRMGVHLPNYTQNMVVYEENVPHFKKMSNGKMSHLAGPSNIFQILGDIQKQQNVLDTHKSLNMPESSRTTTPLIQNVAMSTSEKINSKPVQAFPVNHTAQSEPPALDAHVHKLPTQVLKCKDSLALQKVKTPHNGRTFVN